LDVSDVERDGPAAAASSPSHHNQAITILSHHNIEMNGKIGTIDQR
jgi:hypothetical protein